MAYSPPPYNVCWFDTGSMTNDCPPTLMDWLSPFILCLGIAALSLLLILITKKVVRHYYPLKIKE